MWIWILKICLKSISAGPAFVSATDDSELFLHKDSICECSIPSESAIFGRAFCLMFMQRWFDWWTTFPESASWINFCYLSIAVLSPSREYFGFSVKVESACAKGLYVAGIIPVGNSKSISINRAITWTETVPAAATSERGE